MRLWTHSEMERLRAWRGGGATVGQLCALMPQRPREQIIEALDASLRADTIHEAVQRVNVILNMQAAAIPLINGQEAWRVEQRARKASYQPMF